MTLTRLLLRNLFFHWHGNLAVLLGVVVGTAVLTGALLVGDSLRGSLRAQTLRRLGWVDEALTAPRFFRAALADELQAAGVAGRVCPAIMLQATAMVPYPANLPVKTLRSPRLARHVTLIGVDERFWDGWPPQPPQPVNPKREEFSSGAAWINVPLAKALNVSLQMSMTLRFQKPSAIPRETPLARRDADSIEDEWTLRIGNVLRPTEPGEYFNLRPELETPRVAYVPLRLLQARLGLEGRANALLAGDVHGDLNAQLREHLTLDDWGLTLTSPGERVAALFQRLDRDRDGKLQPREWRDRFPAKVAEAISPGQTTLPRAAIERWYQANRPYLSLESRNLILEPALGDAALAAAQETGLRTAPTLVYLANSIKSGDEEIPYSVVAAVDRPELGKGPQLWNPLADDEIILVDWQESLLRKVEPGAEVTLTYFAPEQHGRPTEKTATFRLAGFVPLAGVAADPDLTPDFPGITDKLTLGEWDPPFPYDNRRIQPRDDRWWKDWRATPKAYISLKRGQELWGSRFGRLTSIRLAAPSGTDLATAEAAFRKALLKNISPEKGGLVFDKVRQDALEASEKGTDFALLFACFSFFLIAAALLLVGLLFRLNLDRRAEEIGLLLATGYRRRTVRALLLGEGALIAGAGVLLGTVAAMGYAGLLVRFLGAIWPGGQLTDLLAPHFTGMSLAIGAGTSLLVSVLTILWAVRVLGRVAPPALLAGQATTPEAATAAPSPWSWRIAGLAFLGAIALQAVAGRIGDHEAQAGVFFGSGSLLLTACLAAVWGWMKSTRHRTVAGGGWAGVGRLGIRNAARHPVRSLLTAGLLAAAAFLLVAVEAFRRHIGPGAAGKDTGLGGFALLAESDLPLFKDLNSEEGRAELADRLIVRYRDAMGGDNAGAQERANRALNQLAGVTIYPFRVRAGDDTSCLNLYQPRRPRLFGVPAALIDRGRFLFTATAAQTAKERQDPWQILRRDESDVPAFGENNTVTYQLGKGLGATIEVADGRGDKRLLRIDGLLSDSVFQNGLLLSERHFLQLYPGHEGYTFFLIEVLPGREQAVKEILESALADRGFEVTPTADRLAAYLAVENTYLSTFQALGGLGLLLGSLGLAVVLLRGVWERRGELALLRALGWRRGTLGWLVLAENGFLLLIGLGAGTASALVAVAPHLAAAGGGAPPWAHLLALLGVVLAVGLTAGALAVASTLRAPLVPALRRE
jgi:ABC-type antimicrobial peptide transport system permease subunit